MKTETSTQPKRRLEDYIIITKRSALTRVMRQSEQNYTSDKNKGNVNQMNIKKQD